MGQIGLNGLEQISHMSGYKCDVSHRQGVMLHFYPGHARLCDTSHMQNLSEVDRVREALRNLMERRQIKSKPLAKKAGLGETSVRDFLDREGSDVKLGTLRRLADALDAPLEDLLGFEQVPITGRVGAGGSIVFDETSGIETAPRPPGAVGPLEALEVVGDSMLPRYSSGDIVYISRQHDGVLEHYIGEYCAVRLATGETYIKLLARGSRPGFHTLRSLNAADIEDVEVTWATPIIFVMPRAGRTLLQK
ncbi:hypothetical protein SPHS6_00409 [Sphingobium sp. S6]|nr:hypothetical protein SPHS6_00409 [Sphingobium sp. S6]